jgi:hypothetical protein
MSISTAVGEAAVFLSGSCPLVVGHRVHVPELLTPPGEAGVLCGFSDMAMY